jgi:hypothetical protein
MIIAVNIGRTLNAGLTIQQATERAWSLSMNNCLMHQYVIGVSGGEILGYFRLINVSQDELEPDRVAFELEPCTQQQIDTINNHIQANNVNLKGVQRGKYI